ncbi:MAG: branched-chain amino acid aminotransferase [Pseudonocardiales bacterium]|nr:branched-chain amino acid aminotransferase [Pseudonocardiales bacterium]
MAELDSWYDTAISDGVAVPVGSLTLSVESQALRYGLSVFEGLRGYLPAEPAAPGGPAVPFAVAAHLRRLVNSLELAALPPIDPDAVAGWIDLLFQTVRPSSDCYLRIAVSAAGVGGLTDLPRMQTTLTLRPMGRKRWLADGVGLALGLGPRKGADELLSHQCKCIAHYAGARRALLAAKADGFDSVLLRAADGRLAEAPTANLFLVRGEDLLTPTLDSGVLAGITRQALLDLAPGLGLRPRELDLWPSDLDDADEAFLSGTGIEIGPVARVGTRLLPAPGPVTKGLVEAYFAAVRSG